MFIVKKLILITLLLGAGWASAEPVDPTLPIDFAPPPAPDAPGVGDVITVNMILVRGGHAIALVNGRYVRINDNVGGAKVKHIGRNYVELEDEKGAVKHYLAGYDLNTVITK